MRLFGCPLLALEPLEDYEQWQYEAALQELSAACAAKRGRTNACTFRLNNGRTALPSLLVTTRLFATICSPIVHFKRDDLTD